MSNAYSWQKIVRASTSRTQSNCQCLLMGRGPLRLRHSQFLVCLFTWRKQASCARWGSLLSLHKQYGHWTLCHVLSFHGFSRDDYPHLIQFFKRFTTVIIIQKKYDKWKQFFLFLLYNYTWHFTEGIHIYIYMNPRERTWIAR